MGWLSNKSILNIKTTNMKTIISLSLIFLFASCNTVKKSDILKRKVNSKKVEIFKGIKIECNEVIKQEDQKLKFFPSFFRDTNNLELYESYKLYSIAYLTSIVPLWHKHISPLVGGRGSTSVNVEYTCMYSKNEFGYGYNQLVNLQNDSLSYLDTNNFSYHNIILRPINELLDDIPCTILKTTKSSLGSVIIILPNGKLLLINVDKIHSIYNQNWAGLLNQIIWRINYIDKGNEYSFHIPN